MALWQITENVLDLPRPIGLDFSNIHSDVRLKEKLVTYQMLKALTDNDLIIQHNDVGRPFIKGYSISLSHTRGWAALMLSKRSIKLGVDIEYVSTRVNRVVDRFIRADEQSDSLADRLINWSAKESLYKALSDENLQYFEMKLLPFVQSQRGKITMMDLKKGNIYNVDYLLNDNFVLTWTLCK